MVRSDLTSRIQGLRAVALTALCFLNIACWKASPTFSGGPGSSSVQVNTSGPAKFEGVQVVTHVGSSLSMNTAAPGPFPGIDLEFRGSAPAGWDERKNRRQGVDLSQFVPDPVVAQLEFVRIRPIRLDLNWQTKRGQFAIRIPVDYPPSVQTGRIVFRRASSTDELAVWKLSGLPATNVDRANGLPALESGLKLDVEACRHRSSEKGEPDKIVIGARIYGSQAGSALLKDIHVRLPYLCQNGGASGATCTIDGARKFVAALPSDYLDQIQSVRLEATLASAGSRPFTLKVGKVLLQQTPRGLGVAGRRWTTTVDGYLVSVADAPQDSRVPSGQIGLLLTVGSRESSLQWFEIATDAGVFAGQGESALMTVSVAPGQREVDLSVPGRIVSTGKTTPISIDIPVKDAYLSSSFPKFDEDYSNEPFLEGSTSGYAFTG